ncbi:MAG: hypothetical protein ACI35R_03760 [Bacillus sp. (in: firmicutes)]
MDQWQKMKFQFAGYFVLVPFSFILSSFLWRAGVKGKAIGIVANDALAISGLYYIMISVLFMLIYRRDIKFLRS